MSNVDQELSQMMGDLSMDQLDDIVSRMESMQINNNRDSDVEGLISAMGSLNTVPNNKKLEVALEGVKKHRKRIFATRYKSLKGKKSKAITSNQMDDLFATMDAIKQEEEEDLDSDFFDDLLEGMDEVDDEMMGGAKKKKGRKGRKQKGGRWLLHRSWYKMLKKRKRKVAKKPVKKQVKKTQKGGVKKALASRSNVKRKVHGRKVGRKDTKPVNRGKAKRKRTGQKNGTH